MPHQGADGCDASPRLTPCPASSPSTTTDATTIPAAVRPPMTTWRTRIQTRWKAIVFVCVVAAIAVTIRYARIGRVMDGIAVWVEHHLAWGVVAMVGIFCVSVVVGIPSTVLEALCGFLFGCLGGAIVSTVGKAMGSVLAFVLGRYFLGDVVVVWMRKYPVVHAISLVFAADATSSWQVLFCAQMSYMPLTIKCYMLSMLDVSTMRFVVTNVLCGIPYSALWSYIGSQAKDVAMLFAGKGKAKTERFVIMGCGIGSGVLGLVAVGFYTKKKLAELQHEVPQLQVRSVGQDDTIDGSSGSCIVIK